MPIRHSTNNMSSEQRNLMEIALMLETLREIEKLAESSSKFQEEENQQAVREFREKIINKLLNRIKDF